MKQSHIEDAIEQNATAPLFTYVISGHSDDVIQVEDPLASNGGDEFYPESGYIELIVSNGKESGRIVANLILDQWAIGIAPFTDEAPFPATASLHVTGYTAVLTLVSPVPLTFSTEE